jgi:hypothetical protein
MGAFISWSEQAAGSRHRRRPANASQIAATSRLTAANAARRVIRPASKPAWLPRQDEKPKGDLNKVALSDYIKQAMKLDRE